MKNLTSPLLPLRSVGLLDQLRERIRYQHDSLRIEEVYVYWMRVFILFHHLYHRPPKMDALSVPA